MRLFEKWFGKREKPRQKTELEPREKHEPEQKAPAQKQVRDTDLWNTVIYAAMDHVAGQMRSGELKKGYGARLVLPDTDNMGILLVERSARNPQEATLTARVVRNGTDYCMMHYIKTDMPEQIAAYLEDHGNAAELYESLSSLSDKIDERF